MLALRWHGRRDVRIEDVELELALGPGMVEAEVAWCGICGSDVAEYTSGPFLIRPPGHPLTGQAPPITLGHEFSGRITALGDGVDGLAIGDRVSADACWRCGHCGACRSGRYNRCTSSGSIGLVSDGGFASRVRFPAYCAVPLPDAVSDEAGALLEPLAVALHALDRGAARPGDQAVVLGFGPIGAACAELARATGVRAIVSEPHAGRRARAEAMGFATFVPDGPPRDVARAVRRLTGGGADLAIDCTGVPAVLEIAPEMTRRGGTVVLVGLAKATPAVDAARLVMHERSIVAALGYADDLPRVAALIATRAVRAERMITRRIELVDAVAELERLATDAGDDIKVLVRPTGCPADGEQS